jgi:hypothetical protein
MSGGKTKPSDPSKNHHEGSGAFKFNLKGWATAQGLKSIAGTTVVNVGVIRHPPEDRAPLLSVRCNDMVTEGCSGPSGSYSQYSAVGDAAAQYLCPCPDTQYLFTSNRIPKERLLETTD